MAKLKFGVWIPTYAWSGKKTDPKNMRRIRESIVKCEKYGIDVDHLKVHAAAAAGADAWTDYRRRYVDVDDPAYVEAVGGRARLTTIPPAVF